MIKEVNIFFLFTLVVLFTGCQYLERKHQSGAMVELNGQYLYESLLDSLTVGLSSEDSARVHDQYVRQWAENILEYDKAKDRASNEIEALVEDYRRSLYVHEYEKNLVERKMNTEVEDSLVEKIYRNNADQFILSECLVKGVMLIIPNGAPNINRVYPLLQNLDAKHLEELEKYAYKYASGYELFTDRWVTEHELSLLMPFGEEDFSSMLRLKNPIVIEDSVSTYILQVTEKHLTGERMPMEYARPEIEEIILNQRRVEFVQREREKLYEEAVLLKKIHFYEKK